MIAPHKKKYFFTIFNIYVAERSVCVWLRNQQGGVPHNTFTFPPPSRIRFSDQQEDYYMYVHTPTREFVGLLGHILVFAAESTRRVSWITPTHGSTAPSGHILVLALSVYLADGVFSDVFVSVSNIHWDETSISTF